MATLDGGENAVGKTDLSGTADLLIGIAGPVSDDELRARAADALQGLAGGAARTAIAFPVASAAEARDSTPGSGTGVRFLSYPLSSLAPPALPWLAVPAAYREIARLAERSGARACVVLAQDLGGMTGPALAALASPLMDGSAQLSLPCYPMGKYEGLLNSGILYPFTRALYGKQIRYPLALDFGVGGGMIARMAMEGGRNQGHSGLWPTVEGAIADVPLAQEYVGVRHMLQGEGIDLSTVLATLAGNLFEDAEKNASSWQRVRGSQATRIGGTPAEAVTDSHEVDVRPLIESFNLGLRNLQEVWGLVLPPVTLLELKRMARLPVEQFRMPDLLWAKIVYDFALAYRLRTISRTHLLGALTPLYLGWVASYAAEVRNQEAAAAEQRIERLAMAYEEAKPHFVARWRWPDRFNP